MKSKHLFTLFFVLIGFILNAQVSLQQTSNVGLRFASEDGLSCIITSTGASPAHVFLELQIKSERNIGVVQGRTKTFVLNPGVTKLDKHTLSLVTKKYLNRDFGNFEQTNGYLPSGGYSVCLILRCADENCETTLFHEVKNGSATSCAETHTINPTPLLLASPFDEAELTNKRPNFSWIPPMPIGSDPSLTYGYTLVELREKQSGESGIRRNRPIYQQHGIPNINLPFPAELADLIVGKTYAWQVDAILGKTPIQTSEVWEFEIVEEEEEVFPMPYVRLKTTDDQSYNALNELKFVFNQEGISKDLHYTILKITGEDDLSLELEPLALKFGENSYKVDLRNLGLTHKDYYILRVTSDKGEKYDLKFRYYFRKELK